MRHSSVFDYNGLVAVSDANSQEWAAAFRQLEGDLSKFLEHESVFRSPTYSWPRDPLHNFSRCFEYPYVLHKLQRFRREWKENCNPKVLDLGSGVTFFPFSVSRLGFEVTCVDVDPLIGIDLPRAAQVIDCKPGSVSHRRSDGVRIPFDDSSVDAVYCISVLEHIPWFDKVVEDVARVLKPGGLFVLSCDIRLKGSLGLTIAEHRLLREVLSRHFLPTASGRTVHPADVLDGFQGPFPNLPTGWKFLFHRAKQYLKVLAGRSPREFLNWTVECGTYQKIGMVRQ